MCGKEREMQSTSKNVVINVQQKRKIKIVIYIKKKKETRVKVDRIFFSVHQTDGFTSIVYWFYQFVYYDVAVAAVIIYASIVVYYGFLRAANKFIKISFFFFSVFFFV